MGAYGFKLQFAPFVRDGLKTHTIRGKRKNPDKPGSTFYGFTGMRTRHCEKIITAPVTRLEDFQLERARVWVGGVELSLSEKDAFAWRDGFRHLNCVTKESMVDLGCFDLMLEFWLKTNKAAEFSGDVIHWDWTRRLPA